MIEQQEQGQTLETILRRNGFRKKEISRFKFQDPGIQVDGKPARTTLVLSKGQEVQVFLREAGKNSWGQEKGAPLPSICYEDRDLIIVNKPSGLACHPGRGHYQDNLGVQVASYCRRKGEGDAIRMVGRLDKDTSGGVVFAKSRLCAARLARQREQGIFEKTYVALVHGTLKQKTGVISVPLIEKTGEKNRMEVADKGEGQEAVTRYGVRNVYTSCGEFYSLLECRLDTGRTHQIRVHMASIGHPVVGDPFYGILDFGERLCLHAEKICLQQPFTGEKIEIKILAEGIPFL